MKLLGAGEDFKVFDAGAARCVVFNDDRKHVVYRKFDAAKAENADYEKAISE